MCHVVPMSNLYWSTISLLVKFMVKNIGRKFEIREVLVNRDGSRSSTSVEGSAAGESHPARGTAVMLSYHKNPPLPVISGLVK